MKTKYRKFPGKYFSIRKKSQITVNFFLTIRRTYGRIRLKGRIVMYEIFEFIGMCWGLFCLFGFCIFALGTFMNIGSLMFGDREKTWKEINAHKYYQSRHW